MNSRIEAIISKFVSELRAALLDESTTAMMTALGGEPSSSKQTAPKAANKAPVAPSGKRSTDQIAEQGKQILRFLKSNPKSSVAQIAEGLQVQVSELTLPITRLKSEKALKIVGERRGTRYSAAR